MTKEQAEALAEQINSQVPEDRPIKAEPQSVNFGWRVLLRLRPGTRHEIKMGVHNASDWTDIEELWRGL